MAVEPKLTGIDLDAAEQGLHPVRVLGGPAHVANVYPRAGIDGSLGGAMGRIQLAHRRFE